MRKKDIVYTFLFETYNFIYQLAGFFCLIIFQILLDTVYIMTLIPRKMVTQDLFKKIKIIKQLVNKGKHFQICFSNFQLKVPVYSELSCVARFGAILLIL